MELFLLAHRVLYFLLFICQIFKLAQTAFLAALPQYLYLLVGLLMG